MSNGNVFIVLQYFFAFYIMQLQRVIIYFIVVQYFVFLFIIKPFAITNTNDMITRKYITFTYVKII